MYWEGTMPERYSNAHHVGKTAPNANSPTPRLKSSKTSWSLSNPEQRQPRMELRCSHETQNGIAVAEFGTAPF
jgi:hypothetical protein